MSTSDKPVDRATTATAAERKRPETRTSMVLDLIKSKIQSELSPGKDTYIGLGKDGKPQGFRAEFAFEVNLRRYLNLQGLAVGEKRRLSNIITFTSAGSDVDALAVPASMYVRETWGQDGTRILQMVENAMRGTEIREVSASKPIHAPVSSLKLTYGPW